MKETCGLEVLLEKLSTERESVQVRVPALERTYETSYVQYMCVYPGRYSDLK